MIKLHYQLTGSCFDSSMGLILVAAAFGSKCQLGTETECLI